MGRACPPRRLQRPLPCCSLLRGHPTSIPFLPYLAPPAGYHIVSQPPSPSPISSRESSSRVLSAASPVATRRHYISHRLPQRAILECGPQRQNAAVVVAPVEMPKKSGDQPLALRRMPLVVIPRKRKYKNYVSRRRNTQLLASLRRCNSDPNIYRSYNHWKELWKPFDGPLPELPRAVDDPVPPKESIPDILPTPDVLDKASLKVSNKDTGLSSTTEGIVPCGKISPTPKAALLSSVKPPSLPRNLSTDQPAPTAASPRNRATVTKQASLSKPPVDARPLIKSTAPSPVGKDSTIPKTPETVRKSDGIELVPPKSAAPSPSTSAVAPSAPKAIRKSYGSKSGTTICAVAAPAPSTSTALPVGTTEDDDKRAIIEKKLSLRRKKNEIKDAGPLSAVSKSGVDLVDRSDQAAEQRAKKTVNAVTAAFSSEEKKEKPKEAPKKEKPLNPAAASLLAQLQLPPSVSAKVDKIIASGGQARRSKVAGNVSYQISRVQISFY